MCGANKLTGSQSYYRMSEFHFLVMVLFSTIISCFVLDLLEPQEMVLSHRTWIHFLFAQDLEACLLLRL